MSFFAEIFTLVKKSTNSKFKKKSDYIFYKIVDSFDNQLYALQCINTNAIFHANIFEIVFDLDILYGLHPVQACYIGIEYAKCLKQDKNNMDASHAKKNKFNYGSVHRYGKYSISYQNRQGKISFTSSLSNEIFLMDPRDIALSPKLIDEFDSAQAFYIGLYAGLKINNSIKEFYTENNVEKPYLKLVK